MADALCLGIPRTAAMAEQPFGSSLSCVACGGLLGKATVGWRRSGGEQVAHQGWAVVSWWESSLWSNRFLYVALPATVRGFLDTVGFADFPVGCVSSQVGDVVR